MRLPTTQIEIQYYNDLIKLHPIRYYTNDEIIELIERYRDTKNVEIRNNIVSSFYNYVLSIIQTHDSPYADVADLISEGILGLIVAIETFDTSRGVKFVTFAHKVVSRYIREAIDYASNIVQLPKHIRTHKRKASKLIKKSEETNTTLDTNSIPEYIRPYILNPELFTRAQVEMRAAEINVAPDYEVITQQQTEDDLYFNERQEIVGQFIDKFLTDLEAEVVRLYFGIEQEYPITSYAVLGNHLELSINQIKEVLNSALYQLRLHGDETLKQYL